MNNVTFHFTERRKVIWSQIEYEPRDTFASLHGLELLMNISSSCLGNVYSNDRGKLDLNYLTALVHVSYFSLNLTMLLMKVLLINYNAWKREAAYHSTAIWLLPSTSLRRRLTLLAPSNFIFSRRGYPK